MDPGIQVSKPKRLSMFGNLNKLKSEAYWIQGSRDPGIQESRDPGTQGKRKLFVWESLEITNLALWDPGIQIKIQ